MKKHISLLIFLYFLVISLYLNLQRPVIALLLSTNSRWIVDDGGKRVKLACVNWGSHHEAMVAEGLSRQPLDAISKKIASMGFNCVRLTCPLFLVTNNSASITVRESFQRLGFLESIAGIKLNNPSLLDLPLIQAFKVVVSNLTDNNVMVILDNHISKPGWCCRDYNGNGFGDQYVDPDLWLKGLTQMASMFSGTSNVIAISLRNELIGSNQSMRDRYMKKGIEAVHTANPSFLIILSGLNYDTDLSFLAKQPVNLTFTRNIVFEVHWHRFSDVKARETKNPNQVCGSVVNNLMRRASFLLKQGWPLFLSEFVLDRRGTNADLSCMVGVAAELDLDWALWTLVWSYYLKEGVTDMEEVDGVLIRDWRETQNSSFIQRISAIQSPFQGPGLSEVVNPYKVIFHPSTGLCILRKSLMEPLKLGSCLESEAWSYTPQKTLVLKGTYFCLQADDLGKPAKLGIICSDSNSKWEMISDSKMHLSSKLANGATVCLDIGLSNTIVTNPCKCQEGESMCDPGSQWFKIVTSTRSSSTVESRD